jgi:hypothetical protein
MSGIVKIRAVEVAAIAGAPLAIAGTKPTANRAENSPAYHFAKAQLSTCHVLRGELLPERYLRAKRVSSSLARSPHWLRNVLRLRLTGARRQIYSLAVKTAFSPARAPRVSKAE